MGADRKREIANQIERLARELDNSQVNHVPNRDTRAAESVQPWRQSRFTDMYVPDGWLPAGITTGEPMKRPREDTLNPEKSNGFHTITNLTGTTEATVSLQASGAQYDVPIDQTISFQIG